MPSTKPPTKGEALSSSATAKKRTFIPSVVNPYSEFTQPQFDAFVSDITTKIRDALHGGRKKDKGKGKDMSLFGGNTSTTAEQGDALGFEHFSFSSKVLNGLNGSSPLDAAEVLTDEEEQDKDTEQEEQEAVDGGVEKQSPRPVSDEEQEPPEPPQVVIQGAGGADDPIVIDLLDSDEEEPPQVNGKYNVDNHEEFQCEEESDDEEDEDEGVPGQTQNNLIEIDSDEESQHHEEQRVRLTESDRLDAGEVVSSYLKHPMYLFLAVWTQPESKTASEMHFLRPLLHQTTRTTRKKTTTTLSLTICTLLTNLSSLI